MKTETEINLRRQRDTDYREHRGERGWLLKNAYVSVWRKFFPAEREEKTVGEALSLRSV